MPLLFRLLLFCCLFAACSHTGYDEQHLQVVLRDIGHRVLLHAGDSSSRVLPIEKIGAHTYQISFEHSFAFEPDTLVHLTRARLKTAMPAAEYIVTVVDCVSDDILFAYEINTKNNDIVPCQGRAQPERCYRIRIIFPDDNHTALFPIATLLLVFSGLALGLFLRYRKRTSARPLARQEEKYIQIGNTRFSPDHNRLQFGTLTQELSDKEAKLLRLLAENSNQTLDRERLMHELWGEEGIVVISRNLDVLVSKLRKKLQPDESIRITNVHAKGYKLEVKGGV